MTKFILNNGAQFSVDLQNAVIDSILYNGTQLVCGKASLFAVKLRNHDGSGIIIDGNDCVFDSFDGKTARYVNDKIDVNVHLELSCDNANLLLRADVTNKTDGLVEWVELMSVDVFGKLRDEIGGKGAIVYPFNEGGLVTNMVYRESMPYKYDEPQYPSKSGYSIFPNMICSQFLAYVVQNFGLYLGMHDNERTTKHIDFRYDGDCIKLQMRVFANVNYGENYTMPFDCVMTVFNGGWQSACDIYRNWLEQNLPCGLQKIADNKSLPQWYHNSPVTLIYPVRGERDTGDMTPNGLYPYINVLPLAKKLANVTQSPVMSLLMHWEGTAPWAPPYVWPPFGGEKVFDDFVKAMHDENLLVGLYMSGMGYTLHSNVLPDYDCTQKCVDDGIANIVCTDSDGTAKGIICPQQRKGLDLCPACEQTKQIMSTEIAKLCNAGVDYVQALDQNHGGNSYFCYSDKHGHVPAPGKWQWQHTAEMLQRAKHDNVLFGCESAAAEPLIANLPFSDNRFQLNLYVGTPIPVYSYLYHEYVNNFMGNQVCAMLNKTDNNYPYRLAYSFVAGDMLSIVVTGNGDVQYSWDDWIQPRDKFVDKDIAFGFLSTLCKWRQGGARDFLHLGRMVQPLKLHCEKESFILDDGSAYHPDQVLTSAYTFNGKTVQFVVNYNTHDADVTFDVPVSGYTDCQLTQKTDFGTSLTIPPLSVVMLEL